MTETVTVVERPTGEAWDQWQGTWDSTVAYAKLDAVEHNGASYIADEPTDAGDEPGVSPKWDVLAEAAGGDVESDETNMVAGDRLEVQSTGPTVVERVGATDFLAGAFVDACHPAYGAGPAESGSVNRDAIQAALDDAGTRPVTLSRAGSYDVAKRGSDPWCVQLPAGAGLVGLSREATRLRLPDATDDGCHLLNVLGDDVTAARMTLDGNKANQSGGNGGHGLRDSGGRNRLVLCGLRAIDNRHYGIGLQDRATNNQYCTLYDLLLENNESDGIDVKRIEDSLISQIVAVNNGNKGVDVRAWGVTYSTLSVEGNTNAGIAMRGNPTDGTNNFVHPNRCAASSLFAQGNGDAGIVVDIGHSDHEGEFGLSAATARGNASHGVVIRGSATMFVAASGVTSKDNDASGVLATCHTLALTGCAMVGNLDWGFDNNGEDHNHAVVGNVAQGNSTGQIQSAGASALHANNLT